MAVTHTAERGKLCSVWAGKQIWLQNMLVVSESCCAAPQNHLCVDLGRSVQLFKMVVRASRRLAPLPKSRVFKCPRVLGRSAQAEALDDSVIRDKDSPSGFLDPGLYGYLEARLAPI